MVQFIRSIDFLSMYRLRAEIRRVLRRVPVDFGGGCSVTKAYALAELIRRYNLQSTADIGVYRGRSFFPQAIAHARFSGGVGYGIDPWAYEAAREEDNPQLKSEIETWARSIDFESIYTEVLALARKLKLSSHAVLLRTTSADAATRFRRDNTYFDLVHIDGNHDYNAVRADLDLYLPRLTKNGYIVLDDITWDSVKPIYSELERRMALVHKRVDADRMNEYAIFWNGESRLGAIARRAFLAIVARDFGQRPALMRSAKWKLGRLFRAARSKAA